MRRRSLWEAADAGLLLWREHFVWFLPFFALPLWIAAFGFRLLPFFMRPWSYLFLWWMKPLFDRPVLHIIAVRFFEPRSPARRLFRGLGTSLLRGLGGDVLWRRFSPRRPGSMPIRVLETPPFREMKRRKQALRRGGLDFCVFITILGLVLETALLGGELLFSLIMTELFRPDILPLLWDILAEIEVFIFAAYCLNYILIESLTVCMGFGIYINSRVEVEGWDIEILLRQFAASGPQRPGPASGKTPDSPASDNPTADGPASDNPASDNPVADGPVPGGPAATPPVPDDLTADSRGKPRPVRSAGRGGIFLLLCLVFSPLPGYAENPESAGIHGGPLTGSFGELFGGGDGEAPEELLAEILSSRDFGDEREGWGIRFKNRRESGAVSPYFLPAWMESIKRGFAAVFRFCLILALGGGAVFLLLRLGKQGRELSSSLGGSARELFKPRREDPAVLLNRAELFRDQGRYRDAWALCLAGAIAAYERCRGISFPPGATEYECLALVRSAGAGTPAAGSSQDEGVRGEGSPAGAPDPGEADGFADLVLSWVSLAYGGKAPGPGAFERSLAFCRSLLPPGHGERGAPHG
jgi:hypothetical protein